MSMGWSFIHNENQNEEAAVFGDGGMPMLTSSDEYQSIDFFESLVDKNPLGFETVASVPLDCHPSPVSHSQYRSVPLPFTSPSPPSEFHYSRELDDEHDGGAVDMVDEDQIPMHFQTATPTLPVQCCAGVLLAQLSESLSTQLVRLNTETWDLGVLSVTSLTTDSGEVDVNVAKGLTNETPIFNPLLSILVSMGRFLDVCNMFMAPECSARANEASTAAQRRFFSMHETGESRRPQGTVRRAELRSVLPSLPFPFSLPCSNRIPTSSSFPRRTESRPSFFSTGQPTGWTIITAAQLLTVVSCYLQVVTIYNDIFSHLLFQLTLPPPQPSPSTQHPATGGPIPTGTNTATSRQTHSHHTRQAQLATHGGAPMVPSLILAGYSVPLNVGLRMRLLVDVVEHQFEQIEHVLGLPGPYCVSTSHQQQNQQRKDAGGGLLAGREAIALLEAVMGLSFKMDSGGADAGNNADYDSTSIFASLRENFNKAQLVRRGGGQTIEGRAVTSLFS
jgi:hypothetical protein